MGKNVLKSRGLVLGKPSSLLRIFFSAAILGVMAVTAEQSGMQVLKDLNLRIPHKSRWNISQTEFETKHREYFDLVEQNQRRRLNSSSSYDEENIVRKKLFTFTHSGLRNSPSPRAVINSFNYDVHIPEEANKQTEVEDMSLRLMIVPKSCARESRRITLQVSTTESVKEDTFLLEDCSPKWVGVDLNDGLDAKLKTNFKVVVRCQDCLGREPADLTDPYLNVIVNVKTRLRRRRAERKKRRRFPGKCVRHPWEVDLNKLKGYEYIVQPRKFDAGLCAGKCTAQWNLATQHSNLQYLFSNIDKTIPKPCCAPSKMESLEILYPDEDNPKKLKVSVWNDTKIVECACS